LDILPPDFDRFPALQLGYDVARAGGTAGAVLNAANEAAVAAFLQREIPFTDIVTSCREVLNNHQFESKPSFDTLVSLDLWARREITKWIAC
jgi:1-deoxy-D-xylulose-5-phosphate reductoisomerase